MLYYTLLGAYALTVGAEVAAIAVVGGIMVRDSYRMHRQEQKEMREATHAVEGLVEKVNNSLAQSDRKP